ncbi:MAG: chromosome segregation protein SMC [Pseudomonadota bacterium]
MAQPDLLQSDLNIRPLKGAIGPRLWVKRLAVWREPGGELIRDIAFRPGLNIIWSPDGADSLADGPANGAMGHGSGKTLFCRLLRYCLGEDRFAPEDQRERIGAAFLNGMVGAEVMLDGTCWVVVRPLGVRRRHMAVPNGNLDEVAAGEGTSTGLEPFLNAIQQAVLTTELSELIPGHRQERRSWLVALAWLMRDQECRFDHVLDWRSATSDSDSPVRGLNQTEKLDALRAFLLAINPEEHSTRAEVARLDDERRGLELEVGHRRWEIERTRSRLIAAFGLAEDTMTDGPMAIEMLRKSAQDRLTASAHLPAGNTASEIEAARREYETGRAEVDKLLQQISALDAQIPVVERLIGQIQGEFPGLSYSQREAKSPVCPICEVPLDRALAEGCGLSHKLPDLEACRQRWTKREQDLTEEKNRLHNAKGERTRAQQQLAVARQQADRLLNRLRSLEQARDARETAWYSARRLVDDVNRFAELNNQQDSAAAKLRDITTIIDTERERVGAFRDKQARVFGRLSDKFDPIVRRLIGRNSQGRVALTGNGLELTVKMGGDRSTAAIDSLKVLAFDLSALCLSIEGATRVPAFLVHDSPREADLGLTLYHQLFQLARWLEGVCGQPLFQYIVTTTTQPPPDLAKHPWIRLTLRGAPAAERLLRCDL